MINEFVVLATLLLPNGDTQLVKFNEIFPDCKIALITIKTEFPNVQWFGCYTKELWEKIEKHNDAIAGSREMMREQYGR